MFKNRQIREFFEFFEFFLKCAWKISTENTINSKKLEQEWLIVNLNILCTVINKINSVPDWKLTAGLKEIQWFVKQ